MSLNADEDSGPEAEPDYNEEEPSPDPSAGDFNYIINNIYIFIGSIYYY